MQSPQLLIYEPHPPHLAGLLSEAAKVRGWWVRQVNHIAECLRALRKARPAVLLVRLGADPVRELTLVERVAWLCPETAVVVVGDTANPALAGLAWDLGAAFVLLPPQSRELLPDLIAGFMATLPTQDSPR
jgi:DNA-binding NarL/FixJ family response regulator